MSKHAIPLTPECCPTLQESSLREGRYSNAALAYTLQVLDHDGQGSFTHPFTLRLTTTLDGPALKQSVEVTNRGDKPMPFTAALHTYYRVNDISKVCVHVLLCAANKSIYLFQASTAGKWLQLVI